MRLHTIYGQKLLDRVGGFMRDVGGIVPPPSRALGRSGYPDGLAGDAIPLEARVIFGFCDTWHAMRSDARYRRALWFEEALAELRIVAGAQLDPAVVEVLMTIVTPVDRR